MQNDQINEQINDQINDQINELDLIILKAIHNNLGIKVSEILRNLTNDGNQVNEICIDCFFV